MGKKINKNRYKKNNNINNEEVNENIDTDTNFQMEDMGNSTIILQKVNYNKIK
jgi:hypothetical protein